MIELRENQLGREYYLDRYFDKAIWLIPHMGNNPYMNAEGKFYKIAQLDNMLFKHYDTKLVLCGQYIKVYTRRYYDKTIKYDVKTGKVIKCYQYNTSNKRGQFMEIVLANEDVLRAFITLTFKEQTIFEDASKAFNAWVKRVKVKHKDFQYIKVVETGSENHDGIHFHLLTSLDVNIDKNMFVKSDCKKKREYNLTNWKYGYSTAYRINATKDLKKISLYNSKNIYIRNFLGKRNMTKSNGLIKPKVFYFDSNKDQEKIEVFLKDSILIDSQYYQSYYCWYSKVEEYKRNR